MSNAAAINKFAGKFEQAARVTQTSQRAAVTRCAEATKVAFLSAPGAPKRVAGRAASVGYDISDTPQGANAIVRWRGPVHLVNNPTQPHRIEQRDFVGPLTLPGIGFRMWANHRGTKGKRFFEAGKSSAEHVVPGIYQREYRGTLARTFSG